MTFTPVHACLGGISLGLSVFWNARLTGRVTGISGQVRSALRSDLSAVAYLIGLALSVPLLRPLLPPVPDALAALPTPHLALAGLLVGLGTSLANGCTSGHALCGLARFSTRSTAATVIFFMVAVVSATLLSTSSRYAIPPPSPMLPTVVEVPYIALSLLLSATLPPLLAYLQTCLPKHAPLVRLLPLLLNVALGLSFGAGLLISRMALPSKTAAFLDVGGAAWDASLAFVFVGALPFAASAFHALAHGSKPVLAAAHSLPTNTAITPRLVGGAALFGAGWGAVGLCPGPAIVYLGAFPDSAAFATFAAGLIGGTVVAGFW